MRYYDLKIYDGVTGRVWAVSQSGDFILGKSKTSFSSLRADGSVNPSALNLELDVPVIPFNTPQGKGTLRVWGVPLLALSHAANLNGALFELRAGMSAGLPLANPGQAGLIVKGQVFQAFGNWQGINQTLDLVLFPSAASEKLDIAFQWNPGEPLSTALSATFAQAFPGFSASVAVSENLTTRTPERGHWTTLAQFAKYVNRVTRVIGQQSIGATYGGVFVTVQGTTVQAFDSVGTVRPVVTQLAFQDFIGQPTWIGPTTINYKNVMRADVAVGSYIRFPAGIISPYAITTAAAAYPNAPARSKLVFDGRFQVVEVHHFGNFRQADPDSWVTTFNAVSVSAQAPQYIAGPNVATLRGVA